MVKRCAVYLNQNITCVVNLYITSVVSPYQLLALFISICYTFKRFYTKIIVWHFPSFQWAVQTIRCLPVKENTCTCYLCCIPVQVSHMLPVLYTCMCYCAIDLMSPTLPALCSPSHPPDRSWQRSPMLPVLYTCMCYLCCILYVLPVLYTVCVTCVVYLYVLPVLYTCMCYLCCIPVFVTCVVYLYVLPVLYTVCATCVVQSQPSSRQIMTEEPCTSSRSTVAPASCIMFCTWNVRLQLS